MKRKLDYMEDFNSWIEKATSEKKPKIEARNCFNMIPNEILEKILMESGLCIKDYISFERTCIKNFVLCEADVFWIKWLYKYGYANTPGQKREHKWVYPKARFVFKYLSNPNYDVQMAVSNLHRLENNAKNKLKRLLLDMEDLYTPWLDVPCRDDGRVRSTRNAFNPKRGTNVDNPVPEISYSKESFEAFDGLRKHINDELIVVEGIYKCAKPYAEIERFWTEIKRKWQSRDSHRGKQQSKPLILATLQVKLFGSSQLSQPLD